MTDKVTIHDIAHASGVSIATVSLVLNQRPGVAQETRTRVLEAAQTLGYSMRPAVPARETRLSTIGMIVKKDHGLTPQENPFYSRVMMGIEDACRRAGINLLFSMLPVDANNRPMDVPPLMTNGSVDGLLMVGTFVDQTIASICARSSLPVVLVDAYSDTESYDTVVSDNFGAAYQAVDYLIRRGHRHIGLIGSETDSYPSIRDRRNGYLRALKENQIPEPCLANFNVNDEFSAQQAAVDLLNCYPQITALFGVNDAIALGAMHRLQGIGKRVPQDISIIGYDDTYLAQVSSPALTTMHVDTLAMGRAAVNLLSMRVDTPDAARMTLTIHPHLVERGSVLDLNHSSTMD